MPIRRRSRKRWWAAGHPAHGEIRALGYPIAADHPGRGEIRMLGYPIAADHPGRGEIRMLGFRIEFGKAPGRLYRPAPFRRRHR